MRGSAFARAHSGAAALTVLLPASLRVSWLWLTR